MVTIRLPNNDRAKLSMLNRTFSVGWNDRNEGRAYVAEETLNQTNDLYALFAENLRIRKEAKAARKAAKSALDAAVAVLTPIVQDACANLRRATRRSLPDSVLKYYGLPKTGDTPFPNARAEWVEWAIQLQQGDDSARSAGYPGMGERPELDNATIMALHALHELDRADEVDTVAQDQLVRTRNEVNALTREIRRQLRFAVHHMPDAQQRSVLNAYGLRRRYSTKGGTTEGAVPATGVATPGGAGANSTTAGASMAGGADNVQETEAVEEAVTSVPIHYSVPLTLQSNGNGVLYTNGNGTPHAA